MKDGALARAAPWNDDALVQALEGCTLPAGDFDHALHVRLAWIYLRQWPLLEALPRFSAALQRYARSVGAPDKYHETITWAYVFAINERMDRNPRCAWETFARDNPDLFARHPSLLDRWYGPGTLNADRARRMFVMPD